jgi:hypothetical protein
VGEGDVVCDYVELEPVSLRAREARRAGIIILRCLYHRPALPSLWRPLPPHVRLATSPRDHSRAE